MPPVGFETKISAGERPKTYVLDRAATAGTGKRERLSGTKVYLLESHGTKYVNNKLFVIF
jgi:hypothetical protein